MIKTHNEREKKLVRILSNTIKQALKKDGRYFDINMPSIQGIFDAMYYMEMIKDPVYIGSIADLLRYRDIYEL